MEPPVSVWMLLRHLEPSTLHRPLAYPRPVAEMTPWTGSVSEEPRLEGGEGDRVVVNGGYGKQLPVADIVCVRGGALQVNDHHLVTGR